MILQSPPQNTFIHSRLTAVEGAGILPTSCGCYSIALACCMLSRSNQATHGKSNVSQMALSVTMLPFMQHEGTSINRVENETQYFYSTLFLQNHNTNASQKQHLYWCLQC